MKEKYLPIGTVVLLKEASKRLMITGYCSSQPSEPELVYDYVACLFPEGNLAGEDVALFNHDQIDVISHMGLTDEEYNNLNKQIKDAMASEVNEPTNAVPPQNNFNLDHIDFNNLAPFTPDNINTMLSEIYKHGDEYTPIPELTAFDEEAIKKPAFELPSLDGKGKNKKKEEEKDNDAEEDEVEEEVKESVTDGQPVLQLQPIFDNTSMPTDGTSGAPVSVGFNELSRL